LAEASSSLPSKPLWRNLFGMVTVDINDFHGYFTRRSLRCIGLSPYWEMAEWLWARLKYSLFISRILGFELCKDFYRQESFRVLLDPEWVDLKQLVEMKRSEIEIYILIY
jgi:hypothetical protein